MAALGRMFGASSAETFMGLPAWDGGPVPAVLLGATTAAQLVAAALRVLSRP